MTMKTYHIKHRHTGAVLYSGEGESLRDVMAAVRARAYLAGASLARASLDGANLTGANLAGASLTGASLARANLVETNLIGASLDGAALLGKHSVLQIGPIGSRSAYLVAYITDAGVRVRAGCFSGSLDEFRAACAETHGDNEHGREYAAAIAMLEAHAAIWTSVVEVSNAE